VFIGFSFQDLQFDLFLEAASKRYKLWGSDTHYAFMATTDESADDDVRKADRLRAEYGVATLFYEAFGDSHERLYTLVKELREECGAALPDINARTIPRMRT
jgi:hypothetical protein